MYPKNRIDAEQYGCRTPVVKTATCTLVPYETDVEIDTSGGTAVTITLAPAAECKGLLITLYVIGYSGAITIAAGNSQDFSAPTFNGADDGACYYCDGKRYWELAART